MSSHLDGLVAGHGGWEHEPDIAKIAEQIRPSEGRPASRGHYSGDYHDYDPQRPWYMPDQATIDKHPTLRDAVAAYELALSAFHAASDAVSHYESEVRRKRHQRETALREAALAVAAGTKRPTVPRAPTDDEAATETQILTHALRIKLDVVDKAAQGVDQETAAIADELAGQFIDIYPDRVALARDALVKLRSALELLMGAQATAIGIRAHGYAAPRSITTHGRNTFVFRAFAQPVTTVQQRRMEANHQPMDALGNISDYIEALAATDLTAGPDRELLGNTDRDNG